MYTGTRSSEATLIGWTHLIYALHAFSLLTGILTSALVVTSFLASIPSLIAVVLNYVKRNEVRGTWLDSHFRWQIRTFWIGLFCAAICTLFVILTLGLGLLVVWLPLGILAIWFIYRIARGWAALSRRQPLPS